MARGRTSITIRIEVLKVDKMVAKSSFKFVAIDKKGKPSDEWNTTKE